MGVCASKKEEKKRVDTPIKLVQQSFQECVNEESIQNAIDDNSINIDNLQINEESQRQPKYLLQAPIQAVAPSSMNIDTHRVEQCVNRSNEETEEIHEEQIHRPLNTVNFVNSGMTLMKQRNNDDVLILNKGKSQFYRDDNHGMDEQLR